MTRALLSFGPLVLGIVPGIVPGVLALASAASAQDPSATDYAIEPVAENVYRFTAGRYHSAFMVTEEGIVVTDPIDTDAATWLRRELAERFDAPVRYVVYSHNHYDHVYGGEVFAGEATTFVAHRRAREDLVWTRAQTQVPDLVFDEKETLYLGDSRVTLRYHGPNNGHGSISMQFEPAGVMFVTDWITLGRLPYRDLKGYDIHGMIHSTREVLALDFDRLVGGHAEIGTRADVERYLGYLEALYAAVRDGMRAGKSLETLKQEIELPRYSDYRMYDEWLPLNVEGVYETLRDVSYMNMRPEVPSGAE